ncbi:zinc ribbon domain-containing protein [Paramaledivibacter caminithermalis]|uniref:Zinc-ribbon domain-containing protein n=1 Tax=Paramaledivibacter caminithermalis (strain DSM 15212 / CIP 107654 / DViRD3) TaxID=1121301 RepID=A0A1M6QY92_PARC5|nr:zinc ribbon domain-containing protein [Paramaledivibacter caminithermalis]SHK25184.1 zinc-ribbon domain-containing protein [Paramaledivibacter caminithermalis DSM 15212]
MKSIKPGRGPSGMSFIGSVVAVVFGIFWTIVAFGITAKSPFGVVGMGSIFPLFGIVFIVMGVIQAAYHYKNATGKDRFSEFDIVDSSEEEDPSDKWIKRKPEANGEKEDQEYLNTEKNYCPYCGASLDNSYSFCPKCGKAIK